MRYVEGLAQVRERRIALGEVVGLMRAEGRSPVVRYEYWAPATQPLVGGTDIHFAYSFAAQAAQVEVNLDTGEVRVLRMIVADDVGKAVNPLGLQGQIEGGVIMGVGQALTEEFIVEEGRVFSDRLARYRMPGIMHTPQISAFVVEHPTAEGPYGAKGVGEISIIPTPACITNAHLQRLRRSREATAGRPGLAGPGDRAAESLTFVFAGGYLVAFRRRRLFGRLRGRRLFGRLRGRRLFGRLRGRRLFGRLRGRVDWGTCRRRIR